MILIVDNYRVEGTAQELMEFIVKYEKHKSIEFIDVTHMTSEKKEFYPFDPNAPF